MKKIGKVIVILVWIAAIYLGATKGLWHILFAILALHIVEVFVKGLPIGKKAEKSVIYSILMTLIFGFTWWLPLQRELENK